MSGIKVMRFGVHVLFGILLVIGIVRGALLSSYPMVATILGMALGCWYAYGVAAAGSEIRRRAAQSWFAVLLVLWVAAVSQTTEYGWLAFVLLLLAVPLFRWPLLLVVSVVVTGVVIASQFRSGTAGPGAVLGPVVGAVVALGTSAGYRLIVVESEARRKLVAELIATQDDLVLVNEELAAAQHQRGVLAERARLARDIHDTLAQGLSSVVLLSRAASANPERSGDLLATIEQTAAENLAEARRVIYDLSPAALDNTRLPAALGQLVTRFADLSGIRTELQVVGSPVATPAAQDAALLRVAQSALSNVRLHADATRVDVTLSYDKGVSLDVVDDGRGFDPDLLPAPSQAGGYGLRAMAARLANLGGDFHVESAPGDGTAVAARFDA
ncbi:MAG TPA: sensor histidine kinase [Propionibacteriaceae bacterium]|nr:sensor histidine kinase [Propionibacteriaceae bacterium]